MKSQQAWENCTVMSCTACTLHHILLRWPNQGCGARAMHRVQGAWKMSEHFFRWEGIREEAKWYLHLKYSCHNTAWISRHPNACYMPRPLHPPWFDRPNNISSRVQIMEPFIVYIILIRHPSEMQTLSSAPCSQTSLICVFLYCETSRFIRIQTDR
jgi:hypothetical protein